MAFSDYSTTPSANTSINGINLAEGCNASGINDAIRQLMADAATFAGQSAMPSGSIQAFAGATPPSGWLLCDGSAVSRTTYATLFSVVGTTNGAGDGSTTFNLPDFRGKVIVGAGGGYTLGATGGEATHTLSVSEVPSETVTGTATLSGTTGAGSPHTHTVTDPGHTHTVAIGYTGAGTAGAVSGASPTGSYNESTTSATTGISVASESAHTHTFSGTATVSGSTNGGGGAHNNMQPYVVANVIIKT